METSRSKKVFSFFSVRLKILLITVISTIACTCALGVVAYNTSSSFILEQEENLNLQVLHSAASELETLFEKATSMAGSVSNDMEVQSALRINFISLADIYEKDLEITARLNQTTIFQPDIDSITIIGQNRLQANSKPYSFRKPYFPYEQWYRQIFDSALNVWFPIHEGSYPVVTQQGERYVSFGATIKDISTNKPMGVILVDIGEEAIQSAFEKGLGENSVLMLVDKNNEPFYWNTALSGEEVAGIANAIPFERLREQPDILHYVAEESFYVGKVSLNNGWSVIEVIPRADVGHTSYTLALIIVVAIVATVTCTFLISRMIAKSVAQPLTDMTELMKEVEKGDFSVRMAVAGNDEITVLSSSFNVMLGQINTLMNEVYEQQQALRKSEMKALQAQINPHFLYNTLESITWLARYGKNEEIVSIIMSLTKFFRLSLSKGKDNITIHDELEHAESYLKIQMIRYVDKFSYAFEIDEAQRSKLEKYYVPKLLLQPLIENAIYHGIKPKKGNGHITIRAYEKQDDIVLEVQDDGVGMDDEQLSKLRLAIAGAIDGETTKGYGLKNVDSRIKIYFGEQYGLSFASSPGKGTTVFVIMPKFRES